jgi:hypothetical protein
MRGMMESQTKLMEPSLRKKHDVARIAIVTVPPLVQRLSLAKPGGTARGDEGQVTVCE